jgi:hypothetical protein
MTPFSFEVKVERREQSFELALRALCGDGDAAKTLTAINDWLDHYRSCRRGHLLCFTCAHPLRRTPGAVVVMLPLREGDGITGGLCDLCASLPVDELAESILSALRVLAPDAQLRVIPAEGRA